jgi:hypothetical protein
MIATIQAAQGVTDLLKQFFEEAICIVFQINLSNYSGRQAFNYGPDEV